MNTDTIRGVKTCNIRMGSLVTAIRAIGVRKQRHICSIRRYNCTCHGDVFGHPRGGSIFIARIYFQLDGRRRCVLSCKAVHRRLRGCPTLALPIIQGVVVSVHRTGLPSPGMVKGTNDFFVGPVIPERGLRTLRRRCPKVPCCRLPRKQIGVPTN